MIDAVGQPWPQSGEDQVAPYVELVEDRYNPTLRLGYGDPQSPLAVPLEHDMHLNMLISTG